MGGAFMVGVSAENRIWAKVNWGDKIEVTIELDPEERVVDIPADFQKTLNGNSEAKKKFATLSYSKQKELVVAIADAKTVETKQRRIDKALSILTTAKK